MGKVSRSAAVVWSLLSLAGCSAIAGLDGIQEQACAPNCSSDSGPTSGDGSMAEDSTQVDSAPATEGGEDGSDGSVVDSSSAGDDSSTVVDTGVPPTDGGVDSPVITDSGKDGPADTGTTSNDSGCTLGTTTNCGECGRSCSTTGASTTSCTNGTTSATCSPTCSAGNLSCNNPTAPTADNGCECAIPNAPVVPAAACCGSVCPAAHSWQTGTLGSTFYDCVPSGTYTYQLAFDACTAWTGDSTQCDYMYTFGCGTGPDGGLQNLSVCSDGPNAKGCSCWGYDGTTLGLMKIGTIVGSNSCPCPAGGGSPWK